jgi:glucosamine--fructose-6-phosphate aminotransferase (isomerizing)
MALRRCSKCILPETFPGVTFNHDFLCQYCLAPRREAPSRRQRNPKSARDYIEGYRGRGGKYDCMVAISGGRDSSFAAHFAVKELGLRALLCTVDNGFVPEQTMKNVESARDALDLDLIVVHNDRVKRNAGTVINTWRHRPDASMVATFCAGCVSGCKGGLERTARDHGLPLVITGTGEPQLRFGDLYLRVPRGSKGRLPILLGFLRELVRNPLYYAHPRCMFEFAREGYYRMGRRYRREDRGGVLFASAYQFVDWNEARILSTIQSDLGWRNPPHSKTTWRSDCSMHLVKQYMYQSLLGWTKNDMILSGLVRKGQITRDEALERVKVENQLPQGMVAETLRELGVDFGKLQQSLDVAKQHP